MKKKNTFIGVALLIAILMLGIGYASTTLDLSITGTATGVESDENFKVVFSDAVAGNMDQENTDGVKLVQVLDDKTKAEMTVELGVVNDVASATFWVENQSANGIGASIKADAIKILNLDEEAYTSDYFDVTVDWMGTDTVMNPATDDAEADVMPIIVNVRLKKAVLGENVTETFQVVLEGVESVAV